MAKREMSNSAHMEAEIYRSAGQQVFPPPEAGKLTDEELAVFDVAVKTRSRHDWVDNDLILLAQYSQLTVHLNQARDTLRAEGDVIMNARGTPVANPMFNVCDALLRQQLSLVRILGISSSYTRTDKETLESRANKERDAENNTSSLLASPE